MVLADPRPGSVHPLREQAFAELADALPAPNLAAAERCVVRLRQALPHQDEPHRNLVMVAYGGGKDSAYTLAFVRAMQLLLYRSEGSTFRLRVATNRHAGMPRAVLENIDREYRALRLPADPDCELLLVDGDEVSTFDVDSPQRPHIVSRNRTDILMTGHRTFGDGRPTFCNACNLSVVNSFGLAAGYGEGADLIITGDSEREQRQYALWVGRLARTLRAGQRGAGQRGAGQRGTGQQGTSQQGIGKFLATVDEIAQTYFTDIHGAGAQSEIADRRVSHQVPERLRFFSIYQETEYASGDHMELLTGFLGFEFDDIAFSFTESDCGNPALMGHLRGLKCERVYGRDYAEGMAEYVEFAVGLMRGKDFPNELIEQVRARYAGPAEVDRMRLVAQDYAEQTFGLTEQQLVCLVYSPFAGQGAGLAEFLRREHPDYADQTAAIQQLLERSDDAVSCGHGSLAAALTRVSGLSLAQLRVLYRSPAAGRPGGVIETLLVGDPHKALIETRHSSDGPAVLEQISGR